MAGRGSGRSFTCAVCAWWIRSAAPATVNTSKNVPSARSTEKVARTLEASRIKSSESPPISRKLLSISMLGSAQRFGEKAAEDLFRRIPRFPADRGGGGGEVGRRKCLAVELAVGRQRQLVQRHEGCWHHVFGQRPREMLAQRRRVGAFSWRRHNIGDEPLIVRPIPARPGPFRVRSGPVPSGPILAGDNGHLGDLGMAGERCFDLAEFDTESTDFDLMVGAAKKVEAAILPPAGEVAGAVHAAARWSEWVADEAFGGQPRPVQIAARDPGAGNIKVARHADRHRLQRRIQDIDLRVADRLPDRRRLLVRVADWASRSTRSWSRWGHKGSSGRSPRFAFCARGDPAAPRRQPASEALTGPSDHGRAVPARAMAWPAARSRRR